LPSTDKRTPKTYQARKLTLENQQLKWEGFQCISKKSQDCNLLFYLYERQLKRKNRMHGPEGDVSLLWRGSLLPLGCAVGADECNEAAIFPLTIESRAKDQNQKIAGFASSYRAQREQAPSPQ
jgi:hypothetical protein